MNRNFHGTTHFPKGWTVRGSNPAGGEIFRPSRPALGPTQPPVQLVPDLSPGVNCGRGLLLTTHLLPAPRSLKSRAIPLPPLWATTGPVKGLLYLYYPDSPANSGTVLWTSKLFLLHSKSLSLTNYLPVS